VAIAYFGTNSLYDAVIEKYGYQESFLNGDELLFMPKELYKIIIDQDQDGEFFDPIEDEKDLVEEHIHEEKLEEDPDEEYPDEIYDEDEVFSLPLDEDIQTYAFHGHQEENMMNYNPFEKFDYALFHDFGNEEKCQKDLDEASIAEGLNETLLSDFPFEGNTVIQSCEEVINSYDADEFMAQPLGIVDDHNDDFI
jgi:hypothetical protein